MTVENVSATMGIVSTRIGSKAEVCAGCPWGGVVWMSKCQQGTEFSLCNGYHWCSAHIILGYLFCTILTYSSWLFPHQIDSGNPITTFAVSNLHIICTATEVKVLARRISSATGTSGISQSQTHLLTMNNIVQPRYTRSLVLGRQGSECFMPETRSTLDCQMSRAFSSVPISSRHSCGNSWLGVLRTVFNTELLLSGLMTSSPSSTCSWISLAALFDIFVSWIIFFSYCDVSWVDVLILWCTWNSS